MLTKVLLVVLVLAGQMPVRVCTCSAATRPAPERCQTSERPPAVKGCGCGRHKAHTQQPTDTPQQSPAHADQTPADGDRHRPDCPAVNPQPALKSALLTPHEKATPDATPSGQHLSLVSEIPGVTPAAQIQHSRGVLPVPLFLFLLVLLV